MMRIFNESNEDVNVITNTGSTIVTAGSSIKAEIFINRAELEDKVRVTEILTEVPNKTGKQRING